MRLTNDLRDHIGRVTLEKTFAKREAWLKAESNAIAELVYNRLYEPTDQHKMQALGNGFFYERSELYTQLPGKNFRDKIQVQLNSSHRVAARDCEYKKPCWVVPENEDNAVVRRIMNLVEKRRKLELDKDKLRSTLRTLLNGVNTMKRLEEEWPDGVKFYAHTKLTAPTKNVPAVCGADLTAMILEFEE